MVKHWSSCLTFFENCHSLLNKVLTEYSRDYYENLWFADFLACIKVDKTPLYCHNNPVYIFIKAMYNSSVCEPVCHKTTSSRSMVSEIPQNKGNRHGRNVWSSYF